MESVSLVAGSDLGRTLAEIVEEAAELILPYWRSDLAVDRKADESPVTEADRRAEELILNRLAKLYPKVPVIAEEQVEALGKTPDKAPKRFFLVDPLDGTKGFVRGTEAFTVNIGLIDNGQPVAGAVAAPATGQVWFTTNDGAFRRKVKGNDLTQIRVRQKPAAGVALVSHTLTDEEAQRLAGRHGCPVWQGMDSSVKFCLIAEGRADIYPRPGRTMEWDTAAADAILRAAGGRVLTDDGQLLTYGKADQGFANPGFLAVGG
jgi:3'(2'), 5'-bisphosphate nucleotidase